MDGMPNVDDTSPPGLPPMNAPGGQDTTPLVGRSPDKPGRPDYAALLTAAIGPEPKMSTGQKIAAILGPAILAATGHQDQAMQAIAGIPSRRDDWERRRQAAALEAVRWGREDEQAEQKRNDPRYFSGREDQVRFDPASGTAERIDDAPQDFEDYAAAGGLTPGTPEYFRAVEDYVLRGNGPTAFQYDRDLEAVRQAQRITLEAQRQRNRAALRGMPSYRDLNPPPPRSSGRPAAAPGVPVNVKSVDEARALPKGTRFRLNGGEIRTRN